MYVISFENKSYFGRENPCKSIPLLPQNATAPMKRGFLLRAEEKKAKRRGPQQQPQVNLKPATNNKPQLVSKLPYGHLSAEEKGPYHPICKHISHTLSSSPQRL
jgi:hypothetical protein